jgi:hypothetical protein
VPEQICIHTAQGMICYLNAAKAGGATQYSVSVYLLSTGSAQPLNGGRPFTAPRPLTTGKDKLNQLFRTAVRLHKSRKPSADRRAVRRVKLDSWHTITRKL